MSPAPTGSSRGLRAFVLEYLHQRPGQEIFLKDVQVAAKEGGHDWSDKQLQTAFSNLIADRAGVVIQDDEGNLFVATPL
jgi:hypothetical protein